MAVFNPVPTFPISGEGADALNIIKISWNFVSTNLEVQNSYRVLVYLITDTSTPVHDSGVISSSNEFYDLPSSTLINGNDCVWKVTITSGVISRTNISFAHFKTLATPVVTIDSFGTIGQFYTFTATYSQAQSVPVKTYQWFLYDDNDEPLETGDIIIGTTISQTFTGFANATTYKIDVKVVNQNDVEVTSARESFTTSYIIPEDTPEVLAVSRPEYTSNEVDWSGVIVLNATIQGSSQYINGKFNRALELQNGACLQLDLANYNIPRTFTQSFWVRHSSSDTWKWQVLKNGAIAYEVGWDIDKQKFFYERGHRFCLSSPVTIPNEWYLVIIRPDRVNFMFFDGLGQETRRFEFR